MFDKEALKTQAKEYIRDIYLSHRDDEMVSLCNFIDVIFLYIDHKIEEEIKIHEQDNKPTL